MIIHFLPFGVAKAIPSALLLSKDVPDFLSGWSYGLFCFFQPNYILAFHWHLFGPRIEIS